MKKDKTLTAILALLLGGVGIHRLYLGEPLMFVIYMIGWMICWYVPVIAAMIEAIYFFLIPEEVFNQTHNSR